MLGSARIGSREAREGGIPRRIAIALMAAAQVVVLGLAPLADPPPAPTAHRHHLAAESGPGCQVHHDEHCVVCRHLTTEPAGGSVPGTLAAAPPALAPTTRPSPETVPDAHPFTPRHARAPPIG